MCKMLIVEDDSVIMSVYRNILDGDVNVYFANNEELAIAILEEINIDAVVTDFSLDGTSCIGVIDMAKERNPDCKIWVLTAFNKAIISLAVTGRIVEDILLKPISMDMLKYLFNKIRRDKETGGRN